MFQAVLAEVASIQICDNELVVSEFTDQTQFEELPKEIISQILRYAIPTWSLRIDRRTRHACGPCDANEGSTIHVRTPATLVYTAKPTSPHDIRRLLRISKHISSLVRAEYVHTFSGILEVYRFVIQGEDSNVYQRLESITTRDGCPCFSAEDRVDRLQRAMGVYAKHVSAIRLMGSDVRNFDRDISELLPMAGIALIDDRSLLKNLSFDQSVITNSRIIDVSCVDIKEQVSQRWATEYAKVGCLGATISFPGSILHAADLWQGPFSILLECRVNLGSGVHGWRQSSPYFLVGVLVRKPREDEPEIHILNRYMQEDEELVEQDVRLASYLATVRDLEGSNLFVVS